jgi:hypothetical protein
MTEPARLGDIGVIIVTGPVGVTFQVSSPSARQQTVSVSIGPTQCRTNRALDADFENRLHSSIRKPA